MDSVLLLGGVGALFLALVVGLLTLFGSGRGGVARTVRTAAGDGYRVSVTAEVPAPSPHRGTLPRQAGMVSRALTPPSGRESLHHQLDQAGNPARLGVDALLDYKGLLLFAGAGTGLAFGTIFAGLLWAALWTLAGAVVGFFLPNVLVTHLAQKRQQEIRRTLPDVMDMLVVTVEAGLGFEAAMAQIVRNGRGPMVGEFARVLHEMQIGRPRVEALRQMAARTTVAELKSFSSAVIQVSTLGVPMAKVLRQQAAEMRLRRRQRAEELAQKVPVKILFPMILCMLPALFVVVIGPGIINLMATFAR